MNPSSRNYFHWMTSVHESCSANLEKSRAAMGKYFNKGKRDPPPFKEGDLVMLSGKNLKTRRPSKKLDSKMYGPFEIEKIILPLAERLTLPRTWHIHNVFHTKLLEPYRTSRRRARPDAAKVLRELDSSLSELEEFKVEEIMGSSYDKHSRRVFYLVRWTGYSNKEDWTEEPLEHFDEAMETVRAFHKKNPSAAKDPRIRK